MKKSDLFFSVYNEETIDKDLEIEATLDNIKELSRFLNKPVRSLYDLGIKKEKGLRTYLIIDEKKYLIIVDRD